MRRFLLFLCTALLSCIAVHAQDIRSVNVDLTEKLVTFVDQHREGTAMTNRKYTIYFVAEGKRLNPDAPNYLAYLICSNPDVKGGEYSVNVKEQLHTLVRCGYKNVGVAVVAQGYYNGTLETWHSQGCDVPGLYGTPKAVELPYIMTEFRVYKIGDGGSVISSSDPEAHEITVDYEEKVYYSIRIYSRYRVKAVDEVMYFDDSAWSSGDVRYFEAADCQNGLESIFVDKMWVSGKYRLRLYAIIGNKEYYDGDTEDVLAHVRIPVTLNKENYGSYEPGEVVDLLGPTNAYTYKVDCYEPVQIYDSGDNAHFVMPNHTVKITATAQYHTVRFLDWDGTVLKTEVVADKGSATAPSYTAPSGYTFAGWDKRFSTVTDDMDVQVLLNLNVDAKDLFVLTHEYEKHQTLFDGKPLPDGYICPGDILMLTSYVKSVSSLRVYIQFKRNDDTEWTTGQSYDLTQSQSQVGQKFQFRLQIQEHDNYVSKYIYRFRIHENGGLDYYTNALILNMQYPLSITATNCDIHVKTDDWGSVGFNQTIGKGQTKLLPIGNDDLIEINAGSRHNEHLKMSYAQNMHFEHSVLESGYHSVKATGMADQLSIGLEEYTVDFEVTGYNNNRFPDFQNGLRRNLYATQTVYGGYEAVLPEDPKNPMDPDSKFLGWYKDGEPCDLKDINEDTYVTAEFEYIEAPVKHTVTFYDYTMHNVLSEQEVLDGQAALAPEVPVRAGYVFTGWSSDFNNITHSLNVWPEYEKLKYALGDVDMNGSVDINDVAAMVRIIEGVDEAVIPADMNGDNRVSIKDLAELIKLLLP